MYHKIIRRSLSNMKDSYLIYVLACSFAISIFSILLSMNDNPSFQNVSAIGNQELRSTTMAFGLLFVFCTFIYMAYVGGFFIKQQHQEFLTFEKLGMPKLTIIIIGFVQTIIVQVIAWIIGIFFALVFQKFFGMLLLHLMHVRSGFRLGFSGNVTNSLWQFFIYSTLIFGFLNAYRSYRILRSSVKGRKRTPNLFLRTLAGIFGIVLFISGLVVTMVLYGEYNLKMNLDSTRILVELLYIATSFLLGTYLIYFGFLPIILSIMQHIRSLAYSGTNIFSFKYLKERLINNSSILWFITELSALALVLLSFCYFGYETIYNNYQNSYPFEVVANKDQAKGVQEDLKKHNVLIKSRYHTPEKITVVNNLDGLTDNTIQRIGNFIPYSEYKKLPKKITAKNPKIGPNDYLRITGNSYVSRDTNEKYTIQVKNYKTIRSNKTGTMLPYGAAMYNGLVLVVPDKYYQALPAELTDTLYGWHLNKNFKLGSKYNDTKTSYDLKINLADDLNNSTIEKVTDNKETGTYYGQNGFVRQDKARKEIDQMLGYGIFIVSIFSVALLIALGSVLVLRILLRDDSEWLQLRTLRKIGVSNQEIKRIVRKESLYSFAIPIIFAILQSFVSVALIDANDTPFTRQFIMISLSYIMLYGIIGFITYIISWRGVKQKIN